MAGRKTLSRSPRVPEVYLKLVRQFPLRPIRSDEELDRATAIVDTLLARDRLEPAEEDYLDVLSDLVKRYEDEAHSITISDLSDAEMLQHLIEARSVTQVEVAQATRIAASTLSEILQGKRKLNRTQVAKLARYFNVPSSVFL